MVQAFEKAPQIASTHHPMTSADHSSGQEDLPLPQMGTRQLVPPSPGDRSVSRVQLPRPYGATKKKRLNPTAFNTNAATNMHRHFTAIERQYEDDLRTERQEADRLRTEVECLRQALANACADRGVTPPPATSQPPMPTRMPSALSLEPDDDWLNAAMEALTADLNAAPIDSVWGGVAMVAESPNSVLYDLF